MTQLSIRLKLAILRSKLPDKALISLIEEAEKPKPLVGKVEDVQVFNRVLSAEEIGELAKPKRRYRRRDMRAE